MQGLLSHLGDGRETHHLAVRHRAIEGVGNRHSADQDQHDEAQALLTVV